MKKFCVRYYDWGDKKSKEYEREERMYKIGSREVKCF